MSAKLIVNADDYGHSGGVSAGIRTSHRHGIVSSTTAMMNMPAVVTALAQAQQECPDLGLGVHLVLTTGRPVLAPERVRSLTDDQGLFLDQTRVRRGLPALDTSEVLAEWDAQVTRFVDLTGRAPDHLDSHHHVAYWSSGLLQVLYELAQRYGCAVRLPVGPAAADLGGDLERDQAEPSAQESDRLPNAAVARHPDDFVASFYGAGATEAALLQTLDALPEGRTTEIMCHPGYADAELMKGSSYTIEREHELAILTSEIVKAHARRPGVQLISFAQL